jgi:hypothetical protein
MPRARIAMMTIPTVALMVSPDLTADSAWPPMMLSTTQNPVKVARFSSTTIETRNFPKAKRACTSCRMPVRGPQVHMYATGSVLRSVKKRITRAAEVTLRPKESVPTMPNVTLNNVSILTQA